LSEKLIFVNVILPTSTPDNQQAWQSGLSF